MDKYRVEIVSKPDLLLGHTNMDLMPALKLAVETMEKPLPGIVRIRVVHESTERALLYLVREKDGSNWEVIWEIISDSMG